MGLEWASRFLVQQPLHILGVAAAFSLLWGASRQRRLGLAVPACAWLAYAAWEGFVLVRSPEANIRIDLLLIWPLVAVATCWPVVRAMFRAVRQAFRKEAGHV